MKNQNIQSPNDKNDSTPILLHDIISFQRTAEEFPILFSFFLSLISLDRKPTINTVEKSYVINCIKVV